VVAVSGYTSLRAAPQAICDMVPFRGNSLRGEWVRAGSIPDGATLHPGWLGPDMTRLLRDIDTTRDLYVIWSYRTPIAWTQGGPWVVVTDRFSRTTTQHQHVVAHGIRLQEGAA
jgi:hypothetical protein